MSFDLYLQAFREGAAAGMPLEIIRNAFGKYVVELEEDYWQVQYGNEESSDIFLQALPGDTASIHAISIHRPCRDIHLWQSLWLLLELPGTIVYFPGGNAPMTRDRQVTDAMPAEMRESLGEPVCINDAIEIFQAIEGV